MKKLYSFIIIQFVILILASGAYAQEDTLTKEDLAFLDKLQKDTCQYFLEEIDKKSGLVKDSSRSASPCSIAGVGFQLSALCIADYRKWIDRRDSYKMALKILKTCKRKVEGNKGFFYHFVDVRTGKRVWRSELSSIDTALFLAGALFAGEYFGKEVKKLSLKLYEKVDWEWMLNNSNYLCMGWKPESGFLRSYWDSYSELMILYALAIGAPKNQIDPSLWFKWLRHQGSYKDSSYVYCGTGSLFVYQFSHAWIDFRKIKDPKTNWWENSVKATEANRQFCIDMSSEFKTFGPNCWGISASLGPNGYKGYGGQKAYYPVFDGTIAPYAVAGSLPFLPKKCIAALRYMYDNYQDKIYWKYGFKGAFNLDKNWFASESLAIDQGIMLLMIENFRSGLVWNYFMKLSCIKKWKESVERSK